MTPREMERTELIPREGVRDLVARYTWAGDQGRTDDVAQCFMPDGILDVGQHGFEISEARDFVFQLDERFPFWLYFLSKARFELQSIMLCFLPPFLTPEAKARIFPEKLKTLMEERWLPAMTFIGSLTGAFRDPAVAWSDTPAYSAKLLSSSRRTGPNRHTSRAVKSCAGVGGGTGASARRSRDRREVRRTAQRSSTVADGARTAAMTSLADDTRWLDATDQAALVAQRGGAPRPNCSRPRSSGSSGSTRAQRRRHPLVRPRPRRGRRADCPTARSVACRSCSRTCGPRTPASR